MFLPRISHNRVVSRKVVISLTGSTIPVGWLSSLQLTVQNRSAVVVNRSCWWRFCVVSLLFSSPEPKVQVSYCHSAPSVVRPSVRPSSVNFHIFNFFSETAERNSTKLDRMHDLNVLYQVCVFRADRKKTLWPPWPLIGWDIFDFFSETNEENSTKLDRKRNLNVLYQDCVFRADRKKDGRLASDWLRHFRLLL